jgi:hypothetical protein
MEKEDFDLLNIGGYLIFLPMTKIVFLAFIAISLGAGILATTGFTGVSSAVAQTVIDNVTDLGFPMTGGNMTGGNMTGGNMTMSDANMTEADGQISGGGRCGGTCYTDSD